MSTHVLKKTSAIWALILLGLFLMFEHWLPTKEATILTLMVPFLYFIPGFLVTKIGFSSLDRLETISLAMLFSLILSHIGIYTVEETTRKMTIRDIALTVAVINIVCALAYLAHRKQLSLARLFASLRSKFHKGHHEKP